MSSCHSNISYRCSCWSMESGGDGCGCVTVEIHIQAVRYWTPWIHWRQTDDRGESPQPGAYAAGGGEKKSAHAKQSALCEHFQLALWIGCSTMPAAKSSRRRIISRLQCTRRQHRLRLLWRNGASIGDHELPPARDEPRAWPRTTFCRTCRTLVVQARGAAEPARRELFHAWRQARFAGGHGSRCCCWCNRCSGDPPLRPARPSSSCCCRRCCCHRSAVHHRRRRHHASGSGTNIVPSAPRLLQLHLLLMSGIRTA